MALDWQSTQESLVLTCDIESVFTRCLLSDSDSPTFLFTAAGVTASAAECSTSPGKRTKH